MINFVIKNQFEVLKKSLKFIIASSDLGVKVASIDFGDTGCYIALKSSSSSQNQFVKILSAFE